MRAMGYKERGKSCFTNYEDSPEEASDDEFNEFDSMDNQGFMLPKKRKHKDSKVKRRKYYDGPIKFKNNLFGIGYAPTESDLR